MNIPNCNIGSQQNKIQIMLDDLQSIQWWNVDVFKEGQFHPTAGLPWEIGHHDKNIEEILDCQSGSVL